MASILTNVIQHNIDPEYQEVLAVGWTPWIMLMPNTVTFKHYKSTQ